MRTESIYKSPAGERAVMAAYDALLAHWPVPCEMRTIPTRHGDTFTIASGGESTPPLVLIHGAGANSATWAGDVVDYSRHYPVYAVDLLGEPGKSAAHRPAWDGPAYVEWLEDVLDALKIEKAALLGLSQGGWTVLKFATHRPERVERLVLLTPGGVVPDRLSFVLQAIPLSLLGRWGARRINRLVFGNRPVPEEVEAFATLILTHFRSRIGVLPLFSDEELQRLIMPVLLLAGAEDALRDGTKIAARLQPLVPDLTTIIVPGAGYALLDTTAQILPFLATATD